MGSLPLAPKASVSTISPPRRAVCFVTQTDSGERWHPLFFLMLVFPNTSQGKKRGCHRSFSCLRDARIRSEHAEKISGFLLEGAFIDVLTVMTGVFTIGFPFLVEMEVYEKIPVLGFDVGMETRIS